MTGIAIERTITHKFPDRLTSLELTDLIQVEQTAGWELKYFPVEVKSREFTNTILRTCFKFFSLTNKETRKALDSVARTALRATYTLWLACLEIGSW